MIGRNQASLLQKITASLSYSLFDEIVYVDSNSHDGSVQVAQSAGWKVAILLPEGTISAAAGRHVGTLLSRSDWILYLDGDMLPKLDVINQFIEQFPFAMGNGWVGFTGNIVDVFEDGSQRSRLQKSKSGAVAIWFGGAVMLNRLAVLQAGNWNPAVHANEELDLYSRLRRRGGRIIYFDGGIFSNEQYYERRMQ